MSDGLARGQRLEESLEYQQFVANVEEEEAWINEKLNLVGSEDYGDTLAAVQVGLPCRCRLVADPEHLAQIKFLIGWLFHRVC